MTAPRERPVQCLFATLAEAKYGTHQTWNLDRVCDKPRCRERAAVLAARAAETKSNA